MIAQHTFRLLGLLAIRTTNITELNVSLSTKFNVYLLYLYNVRYVFVVFKNLQESLYADV